MFKFHKYHPESLVRIECSNCEFDNDFHEGLNFEKRTILEYIIDPSTCMNLRYPNNLEFLNKYRKEFVQEACQFFLKEGY